MLLAREVFAREPGDPLAVLPANLFEPELAAGLAGECVDELDLSGNFVVGQADRRNKGGLGCTAIRHNSLVPRNSAFTMSLMG